MRVVTGTWDLHCLQLNWQLCVLSIDIVCSYASFGTIEARLVILLHPRCVLHFILGFCHAVAGGAGRVSLALLEDASLALVLRNGETRCRPPAHQLLGVYLLTTGGSYPGGLLVVDRLVLGCEVLVRAWTWRDQLLLVQVFAACHIVKFLHTLV